jgi:hypothetical protein
MDDRTLAMWQKQDVHRGDRKRLFTTVKAVVGDGPVLYPGSYVDVAASMAFSSVTYVDVDKRAARFFEDTESVSEMIVSQGGSRTATVSFVMATTRAALGSNQNPSTCWCLSTPDSCQRRVLTISASKGFSLSPPATATQPWRRLTRDTNFRES